MKRWFTIFFLIGISAGCFAQEVALDSLKTLLQTQGLSDSGRVMILTKLGDQVRFSTPQSSLAYGQQALALARRIHFARGECRALANLGYFFRETGNLPKALELHLQGLRIAQAHEYLPEIALHQSRIGNIYFDLKDYPKSITYGKESLRLAMQIKDQERIATQFHNIGSNYLYSGRLDSARHYILLAGESIFRINLKGLFSSILRNKGLLAEKQGHTEAALNYYRQGIRNDLQLKDYRNASFNYRVLANYWLKTNQLDSCIFYAHQAMGYGRKGPFPLRLLQATELLTAAYKQKRDYANAFLNQEQMLKIREGLFGAGNIQAMQTIIVNEEKHQREVKQAKNDYQNKLRQYMLVVGLTVTLLIAFILYRNNRHKHRANQLLNEQKTKVEQTLETLRTTQTQLIQREKMASLGELTAGIAHEIQNPLNFVNNFAEVSVELAEELEEEREKGDKRDEGVEADLLRDLRTNMQTIAHNGKRASNVVRAMLEHSRSSTGEWQLTDLNTLADEYLRLAYHGIRAKDNTFTCELITDFAADLPTIEVVPQDIGRVLLNLYNNAFYAVSQKVKGRLVTTGEEETYQPTVWVSTGLVEGKVEIRVRDNGPGIPEAIQSKIFQPFFTTKPTGEGTGLGLSLSYDIVTKGHRGEMKVESQIGMYTEFIVCLLLK